MNKSTAAAAAAFVAVAMYSPFSLFYFAFQFKICYFCCNFCVVLVVFSSSIFRLFHSVECFFLFIPLLAGSLVRGQMNKTHQIMISLMVCTSFSFNM